MEKISDFIENQLKLVVNQTNSKVALSKDVTFLGITIIEGTIAISAKSLNRAMRMVKELTPCGTSLSWRKQSNLLTELVPGLIKLF